MAPDRELSALYLPAPDRHDLPVARALEAAGIRLTTARDPGDVLRLSAERPFDACLIDLAAGRAAWSAVRLIGGERPDLAIAGLLDRHERAASQEAPSGVVDLLPWPASADELQLFAANLRDRAGVDVILPDGAVEEPVFETSPVMRLVMDRLRAAAPDRADAVFCGEAGSGRRLLAATLHRLGDPDGRRPLVTVDGSAAPSELERRLFGTSAERNGTPTAAAERVSAECALAAARGGTLLVTHLARMPARLQARLARVLRDGEALVPGRSEPVDLEIRLMTVAASSLDEPVREGELRDDLADRLSALVVDVPALRRRREDIPALAAHFLRRAPVAGPRPQRFSRSALALLSALPWPGNATELRQLVEGVCAVVPRSVIQIDDLLERASLDGVATRVDTGVTLRDLRARFEREYISAVLVRHHGRVGDAAKALGIQRTNLYRKVRQLNVARSLLGARR